MTCRLCGAKPLADPMPIYRHVNHQVDQQEGTSVNLNNTTGHFSQAAIGPVSKIHASYLLTNHLVG